MNTIRHTSGRLLIAACLVLPLLAGCTKEEAAAPVEKAAVAVPANNDENAWNAYLTDVVTRNLGNSTTPYVYTLPAPDTADFQGYYDRQLEKALGDVQRGIGEGYLLAFGSPDSTKSADLLVASFEGAPPATMKSVTVLFIGNQADEARTRAAVEPTGATYKFIQSR